MEDMRPGLRHGDLTTTGGVIIATGRMRFHGKEVAAEGDLASCPACKSMGRLVNDAYPAFGLPGGRQLAIQGAWIFCKCANPPRAIASTDKFRVAVNRMTASDAKSQSSTHTPIFDEQFLLKDRQGNPLSNTYYTAKLPNGKIKHGTTDQSGRTERIQTNDSLKVSIYIGHRESA